MALLHTRAPVLDSAGNLYGTTVTGGYADLGIAYKIDKTGKEILDQFEGGQRRRKSIWALDQGRQRATLWGYGGVWEVWPGGRVRHFQNRRTVKMAVVGSPMTVGTDSAALLICDRADVHPGLGLGGEAAEDQPAKRSGTRARRAGVGLLTGTELG